MNIIDLLYTETKSNQTKRMCEKEEEKKINTQT